MRSDWAGEEKEPWADRVGLARTSFPLSDYQRRCYYSFSKPSCTTIVPLLRAAYIHFHPLPSRSTSQPRRDAAPDAAQPGPGPGSSDVPGRRRARSRSTGKPAVLSVHRPDMMLTEPVCVQAPSDMVFPTGLPNVQPSDIGNILSDLPAFISAEVPGLLSVLSGLSASFTDVFPTGLPSISVTGTASATTTATGSGSATATATATTTASSKVTVSASQTTVRTVTTQSTTVRPAPSPPVDLAC